MTEQVFAIKLGKEIYPITTSNMKNNPDCKTGLKPGIINDEVFDREIAMCQKLSRKNDGKCNWGTCCECGVLPLLYKLGKGRLYEGKQEIEELKDGILGSAK
jgi:hypothetical protein